jgi:hypothetical protein
VTEYGLLCLSYFSRIYSIMIQVDPADKKCESECSKDRKSCESAANGDVSNSPVKKVYVLKHHWLTNLFDSLG